jgi:UDP-2-acetamido-3-amino-2,3-dideoxy-glucuronate N-acetyltransferase
MSEPMIHATAIVDRGAKIGAGSRIWHWTHVCSGARIGAGCSLGQNVYVGPGVAIGNGCKIQNNVSLYEGVTLEDDVFCGPSMVFTNVLNPRSAVDRRRDFRPTLIRRGATIGANATIVCGHTIGAHAFIAAGAVVTTDVPDHALIVGVPGRIAGWMSRHGEQLDFGDVGEAACPATGERYRLADARVIRIKA